jgi:hypothetical protein
MDPISPGFIAGGGDNSPVGCAADNHGFALEMRFIQHLDRSKKGIHIDVEDCPW